ncbi:MAG: hypothetical protein EZS28_037118, partial [Streblomastix strix]
EVFRRGLQIFLWEIKEPRRSRGDRDECPPVKMELRDRQRLKPPKAWSSSDDEDQWLSQSE